MPKQLSDQVPNPICLLMIGPAGTGKTTLATLFPRPYIISMDKNLQGPKKVWEQVYKKPCPALFDTVTEDDNGKPIQLNMQFQRAITLAKAAYAGDFCDTVIFDSTTTMSPMMIADVLRQSPTKTGNMEIPSWGQYLHLWQTLLSMARSSTKHNIFIGHEEVQGSDIDDKILRFDLALPGKMQSQLPALCTDVWRIEASEKLEGNKRVRSHSARAIQSERHPNLKASLNVPDRFEITPEFVASIIPKP